MANFKIKNGLNAKRYLQSSGVETAGTNGPFGVFDTTLFAGNGTSSQTITNSIDLSGDGGLVWMKSRNTASSNWLYDTERGVTKELLTDSPGAESTESTGLTAFNSDGFTIGTRQNQSAYTGSVAWSFKKQAKFFDVVTYTGTGSTQNISHNLGSVPAVMMVKSLSSGSRWNVYHKDASPTGNPQNGRMALNTTDAWAEAPAVSVFAGLWNQTAPTDSVFTVGSYNDTNASGENFVAYLFAHDTASDSNIKCGSYTGTGADGNFVDLGWEPSWVMYKRTNSVGAWEITDKLRGMNAGQLKMLEANSAAQETNAATTSALSTTSTGFNANGAGNAINSSGSTYIYMAIRGVVPTKTLNLSTGHTFSFTPSGATDILFSNPPASGTATGFTVEVNNSGGYALTWPSSIKWNLGTVPVATASKELYAFVTTDGGTTYYGKKAAGDIA